MRLAGMYKPNMVEGTSPKEVEATLVSEQPFQVGHAIAEK
jgi:hypothetical protein